jgi:tight adherence protein C
MPLAIAAVTFVAVTLLAWVAFRPRENVVGRRITSSWNVGSIQERRLEGTAQERWLRPLFRRVGTAVAQLLPANIVRSVDHMLVMANQPTSLSSFLALWGASGLLGLMLAVYVATALSEISAALGFLLALMLVGFFGLGPCVALRRRVRMRQRAIVRELPYALDLIVTCVEAGLGVDAAFAAVADRTTGPISQTLSHYLREVGLGRPRRDALADAADRTGVADLIRIAGSIAQAEEMGTTLGDALRMQAEELRLLRRQRVQEAAQRAPVWMTIPLIFCFLPALAAVIIVPSILNFFQMLGSLGLRPT